MSVRARFVLTVLLVTGLTGIGIWASAQVQPPNNAAQVVVFGNDVGFRIDGQIRNAGPIPSPVNFLTLMLLSVNWLSESTGNGWTESMDEA